MKAILVKDKMPKFLVVNELPETKTYNKHLTIPWKKGEIVKVAPFEKQSPDYDHPLYLNSKRRSDISFRLKYVTVFRNSENGKWDSKHIEYWKNFDQLTKR
jgi:hypothetical protein